MSDPRLHDAGTLLTALESTDAEAHERAENEGMPAHADRSMSQDDAGHAYMRRYQVQVEHSAAFDAPEALEGAAGWLSRRAAPGLHKAEQGARWSHTRQRSRQRH